MTVIFLQRDVKPNKATLSDEYCYRCCFACKYE